MKNKNLYLIVFKCLFTVLRSTDFYVLFKCNHDSEKVSHNIMHGDCAYKDDTHKTEDAIHAQPPNRKTQYRKVYSSKKELESTLKSNQYTSVLHFTVFLFLNWFCSVFAEPRWWSA